MARHRIPQVIDGHLQLVEDTDGFRLPIQVGSAAWYAWLREETVQSFAFRSAQGTLTVRREQSHGNWYWYAYRTQQGQLHKAYLGKLEDLTSERLHEIAATLVTNTSPQLQEPDANVVTPASISSDLPSQQSTDTKTSQYNETLLATKLFIPPPAATLIARPRLFTRLTAGTRRSLTLVTAPAGWGKTTLLSAWHADPSVRAESEGNVGATLAGRRLGDGVARPAISARGRDLAWVSLDASDNDPARFWTYVITALTTLYTGVDKTALALLRSAQPPLIESVLTTLLNDLAVLPKEGVLVLDDYHVIESQPIHAALVFLLEHLPPWVHLVIATRLDPPFPLARLRARGALTEIRAADLRFTSEEAAAFLTEVMDLPLSAEQIDALEARTEGWIAGLHLAALSARGRPVEHLPQFVEAFTGSNRFVLEYLTEEVLGQQAEAVQTFLLCTSILDRLCAPLCDTLLSAEQADQPVGGGAVGAEIEGNVGATLAVARPAMSTRGPGLTDQTQPAHLMLEYLERANLFLIPLDDERRWYRYHNLFADVLRSRLKQTWPALVPELHRRASVWYEQQGLFDEAVQHALAAPDIELAARLIEQNGISIAIRGQVHLVLGWLNTLPDALVRSRAQLCLCSALMLMFTNQLEAAEVRLQDAEACVRAGMSADQARIIQGWVAGVRANLALFSGDLARCMAFSHQTLDLLPETEVLIRAAAMVGPAHSYLMSGDVTAASEDLVAAASVRVRATGDLFALLRSMTLLARLQVLQGRLHQAAITYEQVVQVVPGREMLQFLVGSAGYYFGLGDLLREWNDLDEATRLLAQGMELVKGTLTVDAKVVTQGYLALARLLQARGNYKGALATLDEFTRLARDRHFVFHLSARGAAVRAQIELAQGNLAAANRWADTSSLSVEDALDYPREVEYLTLARVRIAQGRVDPNGLVLQDVLRLLERLLHDAEGKARMSSIIEILALCALASQTQGDDIGAMTALERAVTLAEPEGYMRLFLDEGEPMLVLLSKLLATGHHARGYLQRVLAAGDRSVGAGAELGGEGDLVSARGQDASPAPASVQMSSKPSLIDPLSERELEVLHLIVTGASNNEIAEQLVVALSTVKRHVSNIFSKLAVSNRTQAVARAREIGLL